VNFSSLLHTLQTQATAVMHTVTAVAGNDPQPARTTVIYTIVVIFAVWLLLKIAKKASK
jgi:uncharacterized membrane protein YuzA (DUF378 family)